jgi:hypothetical protein
MKLRSTVVLAAVAMIGLPAVAQAATVAGSRINYTTNGNISESGRYTGPGSGRLQLCADETGTRIGGGGSADYIMRDISFAPDYYIRGLIVEPGPPATCTAYTSTNTGYYYYTQVNAQISSPTQSGWAEARN